MLYFVHNGLNYYNNVVIIKLLFLVEKKKIRFCSKTVTPNLCTYLLQFYLQSPLCIVLDRIRMHRLSHDLIDYKPRKIHAGLYFCFSKIYIVQYYIYIFISRIHKLKILIKNSLWYYTEKLWPALKFPISVISYFNHIISYLTRILNI